MFNKGDKLRCISHADEWIKTDGVEIGQIVTVSSCTEGCFKRLESDMKYNLEKSCFELVEPSTQEGNPDTIPYTGHPDQPVKVPYQSTVVDVTGLSCVSLDDFTAESPIAEVETGTTVMDMDLDGYTMDQVIITVLDNSLVCFNGLELGNGVYTKADLIMLQDDSEGDKVYEKAQLRHEQAVVDTLLTPPNERSWLLVMAPMGVK